MKLIFTVTAALIAATGCVSRTFSAKSADGEEVSWTASGRNAGASDELAKASAAAIEVNSRREYWQQSASDGRRNERNRALVDTHLLCNALLSKAQKVDRWRRFRCNRVSDQLWELEMLSEGGGWIPYAVGVPADEVGRLSIAAAVYAEQAASVVPVRAAERGDQSQVSKELGHMRRRIRGVERSQETLIGVVEKKGGK